MNTTLIKQAEKNNKSIYSFIVEFFTENGYSPSIREICEATGILSTSTVYDHLRRLREFGKINFEEGKTRSISLVGYRFVKEGDICYGK